MVVCIDELDEPVSATAARADLLASMLCPRGGPVPDDCSWYHGTWQYLRLLDMVSSPTRHSAFYQRTLGALAAAGGSRILITGAADYSILAHVLSAFGQGGTSCDVTVIDVCETPLELCRQYAGLAGATVRTVASDLLLADPAEPFDGIVTDAFLTRFPPAMRPLVVASWRQRLRPGGLVVTTVRLDPERNGAAVVASRDEVVAFGARARRRSGHLNGGLGLPADQLVSRAETYARRMSSHPLRSSGELVAVLENAGFLIQSMEVADVPGEMGPATYARVVASAGP